MTDRAAYLDALVSQPWVRDDLHCWAFVRAVRRDLFQDDRLPAHDYVDRRARMAAFAGDPERAHWHEVVAPQDGDIALMTRRTSVHARDSHAGIWLEVSGHGAVWHCDAPHGVVADSLAELTELRRWHPTFYRRLAS